MELTKKELYQLAAAVSICIDLTRPEKAEELQKVYDKLRSFLAAIGKGEKTITITEGK